MNVKARKEQKRSWNAMHQETKNKFRRTHSDAPYYFAAGAIVSTALIPIAFAIADHKSK